MFPLERFWLERTNTEIAIKRFLPIVPSRSCGTSKKLVAVEVKIGIGTHCRTRLTKLSFPYEGLFCLVLLGIKMMVRMIGNQGMIRAYGGKGLFSSVRMVGRDSSGKSGEKQCPCFAFYTPTTSSPIWLCMHVLTRWHSKTQSGEKSNKWNQCHSALLKQWFALYKPNSWQAQSHALM